MDKTEFQDKTGKPLYVGDIIQWKLDNNGMKSGGPSLHKLIRTKKGIRLANPQDENERGWLFRKTDEKFTTLMDTSERK